MKKLKNDHLYSIHMNTYTNRTTLNKQVEQLYKDARNKLDYYFSEADSEKVKLLKKYREELIDISINFLEGKLTVEEAIDALESTISNFSGMDTS